MKATFDEQGTAVAPFLVMETEATEVAHPRPVLVALVNDDVLGGPQPRQWVLRVTGGVAARSGKFRFLGDYRGLEVIRKAGTHIGDNDGEIVTTPYDDCALVMPSLRQVRAGVTVVRFARQEPL